VNGEEAAAQDRGADVDAAAGDDLLTIAADERAACRAQYAQSQTGAVLADILDLR
jgi:hypothetical protein